MNLKKHIKLKKEFDVEPEFTAADQERLNALIAQMGYNASDCPPAKKRVSWWQVFAPVASVAVALVITLTCVFTLRSPSEIKYFDDDVIKVESSFADLQNDVKNFNINSVEYAADKILFAYDSVSKDKLFYSLNATLSFTKLNLVIVINKDYQYDFKITEEVGDKILSEYTVTYCCESSRDNFQATYRGWINVETETVYFEYVQIPALGDEAFFETIQEIIKVK